MNKLESSTYRTQLPSALVKGSSEVQYTKFYSIYFGICYILKRWSVTGHHLLMVNVWEDFLIDSTVRKRQLYASFLNACVTILHFRCRFGAKFSLSCIFRMGSNKVMLGKCTFYLIQFTNSAKAISCEGITRISCDAPRCGEPDDGFLFVISYLYIKFYA